jgi:tRNA G37 N-methylase Trm5
MDITKDEYTEIKEKQNRDFINKIPKKYKNVGEIIILKYDSKNSILTMAKEINFDNVKFVEEIKNLLEKRNSFLNFMAEYL